MSMRWAAPGSRGSRPVGDRGIGPIAIAVAAWVTALLGLGACADARAHPDVAGAVVPSPTRWPASIAGGACYLLDYEVVEQVVGTSFDVSAAGQSGDTATCVLQTAGGPFPDLTVAVTPTDADAAVFKATAVPKGAAPLADLGKQAYSLGTAAADGAGPGVEVGWLSGHGQLVVLRYRPAAGGPDPATITPSMVALAKKVDQSLA